MFNWLSHWITQFLVSEPEYTGIPLCDYERIRFEIRPCDVLLIEGRSRVSEVIRSVTQSAWSHAALYIGRLHDIDDPLLRALLSERYHADPTEQLLIEGIMGEGIIVSPLSVYRKAHIRICRPRGLLRQDAQHVVAHAIQELGKGYDTRQIFDLWRFFFPWTIMPRRWRSSIFSNQPGGHTKTVCSTMIADAFGLVSFPILPLVKENREVEEGVEIIRRNPRLFTPRDFDYSPYFEIIKYPFIQTVEHGAYSNLPWKEGAVSNDRGVIYEHYSPHHRIGQYNSEGMSDEGLANVQSQARNSEKS